MSSAWVFFWTVVIVVLLIDALALYAMQRNTSFQIASWVALVGLLAAVFQAVGFFVYLFSYDSVPWWLFPIIALIPSISLIIVRDYRRYGWSMLIGGIQGYAASFGWFITVIVACNCLD